MYDFLSCAWLNFSWVIPADLSILKFNQEKKRPSLKGEFLVFQKGPRRHMGKWCLC